MIEVDLGHHKTQWPHVGLARGFLEWCVRWQDAIAKPTDWQGRILDVGGGAGAFALVCKYAWPQAPVIVLEPSPNMLPILKQNLEGFDKVDILPYAASNADYMAELSMPPGEETWRVLGRETLHGTGGGAEVECRMLDGLDIRPVHIMKLDVEGHELECLQGALEILEEDHPTVIVEVKASIRETKFDPCPLLKEIGYEEHMCVGQDFFYGWPT